MQGAERFDIPWPDAPPGGKRRCNGCKQYIECNRDTFGTVIHYLSNGQGKRYWRSKCRRCEINSRKKPTGKKSWLPGEERARTRAVTRLIKMAPELFLPIFVEELQKEGLSPVRIKARTAYLNNYIKAIRKSE